MCRPFFLNGVYERSKDVTSTQQQRPESPTVTLTWYASKCMARKLHRRYILSWDADFADHRVCNMIRKHRRPREQCPLHSYATTQTAHRVSLNWRQTKIKEDKRIVGQPWKHILMDTPHQSLHFLVMIARHSRDEDVLVWRNAFG